MQILVINLNRRRDRLDRISRHLSDLHLAFSRVAAIDRRELTDPSRVVGSGTDACWRSHQTAFIVVERRNENSLILEDDAQLDPSIDWPNTLALLNDFIIENEIDVLQLGFVKRFDSRAEKMVLDCLMFTKKIVWRSYEAVFGTRRLVDDRWSNLTPPLSLEPNSFLGGTHCYIISPRAAAELRNLNRPTFLAADELFGSLCCGSARFKIARVKRSLATQVDRIGWWQVKDSDIDRIKC